MEAVSNFHDFVSGLPEAVVYDIRACLKSRGFARDEIVFRGGDAPGYIYQLASGQIALTNYSVDGQEIILTKYQPGDWFGDTGIMDASLLRLPARLARTIQRLLVSMEKRDAGGAQYLQCSHDELARYVAASRQSTSIELKKLEHAGIIRSAYGKIYVLDKQALNDLCDQLTGFEPVAASYQEIQAATDT